MSVEVTCTINGEQHVLPVEPAETLVESLRLRLGLTGVKKACGTGDCGACTVLVDGEALRSCILLTASMQGKSITTIEGLGTPDNLHPVQEAFVEAGGIQCGFCTPGMILTAKAMLDKNPRPSDAEIMEGLSGNLCRCTGYVKIVDSVHRAAEKMAP
ncbi:MAG: (2Fe-2S)-binding protein [Desulfovibrio sp.]|nr:(2Fe-2S)-binding protein [Desulfovibrio sp.]